MPSALAFLLIMCLGYTAYAADRTVLSSVLAPMSTSLGLSNSEVGFLSSAQYIGVLAVVFFAGHLSDRYGRWRVILTGLVIFTSFTWLIGFATDFYTAFLFRIVSGVGEGFFWPVAMASVASYFQRKKGLALGFFYVGFDIGSVFGLSAGGLAYQLLGGWRSAFFIAPVLGVVVIAGVYLLKRSFPDINEETGRIRLGRDALELLKKRNVTVLMLFALLATWASVWQVVFLPYYFFKVMNFSVISSALLSSVVAVSGGLGKVVLGGLSDLRRRNTILLILSGAVVVFYALFFASQVFYLAMIGAVAMGFVSSSVFPIMQALAADSCDGRMGTVLGLTTSFQSIATVATPIVSASLFTLGVGRVIAVNAMIPAVLMIFVALFLREPRDRSAQAS